MPVASQLGLEQSLACRSVADGRSRERWDVPTSTLRLTFSYEGARLDLQSRQEVEMKAGGAP